MYNFIIFCVFDNIKERERVFRNNLHILLIFYNRQNEQFDGKYKKKKKNNGIEQIVDWKKRGGGKLKMKKCGDNWVKGGETYLLS